ncbi:MAG: heavy metal translocating P-type ATPase, partial [Thermoplasmata archaeon]
GESLPVRKVAGDPLIAGALNLDGMIDGVATRVGSDLFLSSVGQLVAEAETSRVPLQQRADRIASRFVPLVLLIAAAAATGWLVVGHASVGVAVLVFVSVVIIACPCAFSVATPAAIVVGTGRAAKDGILFKGQDALERTSRVETVLLDKTGTLTLGRPTLVAVYPAPGESETELLSLAAGIEAGTEHPFARAIRDASRQRGIRGKPVTNLETLPGIGVRGEWAGKAVRLERGEVSDPSVPDIRSAVAADAQRLDQDGVSWSVLYRDEDPVAILAFQDTVSPDAREAVQRLVAEGVTLAMVSGDRPAVARRVAAEVGITDVHAGLRPEEKVEVVRRYRSTGRCVAFVGDGVNDAPALAAADVGIAIGAGTDVAKEAGQVILVRSRLSDVSLAVRIAREILLKVRQNLTWAIGYNLILLPVAAGALVPLFGFGVYNVLPIVGAFAMAISSTLVLTNSLSLRWIAVARRPSFAPAPHPA